jgi:hypothetical protein
MAEMPSKRVYRVRLSWIAGYGDSDTVEIISVYTSDPFLAVALASQESRYFQGRYELDKVTVEDSDD